MTQTPPPAATTQAPPQAPLAAPAPKAKLSAPAVCALVASAIALVPVGVVLGIVALFRTQRLQQRGKRLAVVALSLCAAWTALGMVTIIASAAVIASKEGPVSAFGVGTCYTYHDGVDATEGVDVVGCDRSHDGEIVAHHGLGSSYPGQDAASRESVIGCADDAARAIPDAGRPDPTVTRLKVYYPSKDSWDAGMRTAVCVLTHVDHSAMLGDVLDASELTPLQRQVLQLTNESVLLRLKLHDVPASGWKIAGPLEQRLAEVDRAESAALDALAAAPPAGASSDLPGALRDLASADTTEASQAQANARLVTDSDTWQAQLDAGQTTAALPRADYLSLRAILGLTQPEA